MNVVDILRIDRYDIIVEAAIILVGNDWLIIVSGGDTPHIGAISIGNRYEEKDMALGKHKELVVTQRMFCRLKEVSTGNLMITGGIHMDDITKEQISQVIDICDGLTDMLIPIITLNNGHALPIYYSKTT